MGAGGTSPPPSGLGIAHRLVAWTPGFSATGTLSAWSVQYAPLHRPDKAHVDDQPYPRRTMEVPPSQPAPRPARTNIGPICTICSFIISLPPAIDPRSVRIHRSSWLVSLVARGSASPIGRAAEPRDDHQAQHYGQKAQDAVHCPASVTVCTSSQGPNGSLVPLCTLNTPFTRWNLYRIGRIGQGYGEGSSTRFRGHSSRPQELGVPLLT